MTDETKKDGVAVNSEVHTTEGSESKARAKQEVQEKDPDDAQQRFERLIGQADEIKRMMRKP